MRERLFALRGDHCASELCQHPLSQARNRSSSCEGRLTRRHDDDNQQDDDADDDADAHLHVLPPHLLAHAVGAAAETLRGRRQVVGLILQGIETVATLRGFVQVVLHLGHGAVDLLLSQSAWLASLFAGAVPRLLLACAGHAAGTGSKIQSRSACPCSQMPIRRCTHPLKLAGTIACLFIALVVALFVRVVQSRAVVHYVGL
jgi:hypothetical protein